MRRHDYRNTPDTMTESPRLALVLGGARSGKSRHAEALIAATGGKPVYIATGEAGDGEMAARIRQHQERRGAEWRTVEEPLELTTALVQQTAPGSAVLVDCLTLWLANLMAANRDIEAEFAALVAALPSVAAPVVLVSNEVGQGIVPDNALARQFRDHAGHLHQQIGAMADRVDFVTAGIAQRLK
jgi:adenosylcobinamide kinase/adenosylcobinamide-phosphate guanylyltransferase